MALKELFYTIFKSLNPESYDELTSRPLSDSIKYFFFITFVSLLIMFFLLIPAFYSFPGYWNDKISNFDELNVNFSFQLKQPFYLLDDPAIKVEQSGSNLTDARMLITEDGIFYKSLIFFGNKKVIPLSDTYNLAGERPNVSRLIFFMLPSLLFWSMVFFTIYFIAIIIISILLSGIISRALGSRVHPSKVVKIGLYASTILVLLQLLLIPFLRTLFIPIIAYWILLLIIMFLFKDEHQPRGPYAPSKGNSKKDIFSKKEVYSGEDSQDSLPRKKKKVDFEKENEGYVEWK
jgi:hypothetical protein